MQYSLHAAVFIFCKLPGALFDNARFIGKEMPNSYRISVFRREKETMPLCCSFDFSRRSKSTFYFNQRRNNGFSGFTSLYRCKQTQKARTKRDENPNQQTQKERRASG